MRRAWWKWQRKEEWDGVGGLYGEFILFSEWLTGVKRVKKDGHPDTLYGVFGFVCVHRGG